MRLRRRLTIIVPLLGAAAIFLSGLATAAPLRIAYSAISGAMATLWVAQEAGYFKREALDTELLYIGGGSLLIQSMLSGEVPFAYGPSVPVINAALRGADLVLIANTGNALVFSIMSRPEIKQPANLKGKKIRRDPSRRLDGLGFGCGAQAMGNSAPRTAGDSDRRHARGVGWSCVRQPRCGCTVAAE
jgi:ABC-type nitrate/sulfonate/bicarbonate transport system substrate-binding protein